MANVAEAVKLNAKAQLEKVALLYKGFGEKISPLEKRQKMLRNLGLAALMKLGLTEHDFVRGEQTYRVLRYPTKTDWDTTGLIQFLLGKGLRSCLRVALDEDGLQKALKAELVTLEELAPFVKGTSWGFRVNKIKAD